ncbi:carbohydrate ABC transporter permease [Petrotoga sp. 9PWA.NaAc.5.4]|uniref:carbohydrate ABC transporter permease n=1 Tax=Petrotoga sp. 9PWA.NaAc.5.4 TaxID=1434328 RepID=UPI000CA88B65|nr:carbohydrate ABC transporter permease [Petrotoga sp. 9PWA.NaAc.5.4]PNR95324.1 sugar ABC transporter permease [Petrotoga sp. 9PWA.NaAc.5.4]
MKKKQIVILINILVYIFALLYVLPIIWTIISSFRLEKDLFAYPPKLISEFTLKNYVKVIQTTDMLTYFKNSVIVTVSSTIITIIISLMAGYALAKIKFKSKNFFFTLFLSTLMIPLQVIMISIYFVLARIGWINTYWGLIIPPAATPTGVFLATQYIKSSIPNEVIESAKIDGASELKIFWRIILPLCQPVIAALAVLSFTWRWNDYIWPLLVVSSPKYMTIQLGLALFSGEHTVQWGSLLAMTTLSMIPVLIVFLSFQKYFVKGITMGSIK